MKQIIDERFLTQLELFSLAIKDNVAGLFGGSHQSKKYGRVIVPVISVVWK